LVIIQLFLFDRDALLAQLRNAKQLVQQRLDDFIVKQQAVSAPILSHTAQSQPTRDQNRLIHDIATGLLKSSFF